MHMTALQTKLRRHLSNEITIQCYFKLHFNFDVL